MKIKASHWARLLFRATESSAGSLLKSRVGEVLNLMDKKGYARLIPKLEGELEAASSAENPGRNFTVETASGSNEMVSKLSVALGVLDEQIKVKLNPSLIGGVKIISDRFVVDASVSGQIDDLQKHLMKN